MSTGKPYIEVTLYLDGDDNDIARMVFPRGVVIKVVRRHPDGPDEIKTYVQSG